MGTIAVTVFGSVRLPAPSMHQESERHAVIVRSHDGFPSSHGKLLAEFLRNNVDVEGPRLAALFVRHLFENAYAATIELHETEDAYRHCQHYTYLVHLYEVDGIKRTFIRVREESTRIEKRCKSVEEFSELMDQFPVGAGHMTEVMRARGEPVKPSH